MPGVTIIYTLCVSTWIQGISTGTEFMDGPLMKKQRNKGTYWPIHIHVPVQFLGHQERIAGLPPLLTVTQ